MRDEKRELLELLKFELKFREDGGYGRSPHAPRREPQLLEDSPTCLNFNDPDKPHPCGECGMMDFVPEAHKNRNAPCRGITGISGANRNSELQQMKHIEAIRTAAPRCYSSQLHAAAARRNNLANHDAWLR